METKKKLGDFSLKEMANICSSYVDCNLGCPFAKKHYSDGDIEFWKCQISKLKLGNIPIAWLESSKYEVTLDTEVEI